MLQITIPKQKLFNDATNEFIDIKETTLQLEQSLVSLAKWEATWNKPFQSKQRKTRAESEDYVRCMTITQNVDPNVYKGLTKKNMDEIDAYMDLPMTATTFGNNQNGRRERRAITAEVIYYWMISLGIPIDFQRWHLNRLMTLIRVCNEKNAPNRKRSTGEMLNERRALNEARRRSHGR